MALDYSSVHLLNKEVRFSMISQHMNRDRLKQAMAHQEEFYSNIEVRKRRMLVTRMVEEGYNMVKRLTMTFRDGVYNAELHKPWLMSSPF